MDEHLNCSYRLYLRVTGTELEALGRMADEDMRDIRTEAVFSLRKILIERGFLPGAGVPQTPMEPT